MEYQQKKLIEAENTLQSHMDKIKKLRLSGSDDTALKNEEKMINIWSKNVDKIEKEIAKIKSKIN